MILRGVCARESAGGSSGGGSSGGSSGGVGDSGSGSDDDSGEGISGGRVLAFDPQARKRRDKEKDGGEKGVKDRGAALPRRFGAHSRSERANHAAAGGGEGAFHGSKSGAGDGLGVDRQPGVSPASVRGAHSIRFKMYRVLQILGLMAVVVIYLRSCGQL